MEMLSQKLNRERKKVGAKLDKNMEQNMGGGKRGMGIKKGGIDWGGGGQKTKTNWPQITRKKP